MRAIQVAGALYGFMLAHIDKRDLALKAEIFESSTRRAIAQARRDGRDDDAEVYNKLRDAIAAFDQLLTYGK